MATKLDLSVLQLIGNVIVGLVEIIDQLIATASSDASKLAELNAAFDEKVAEVASLAGDNETVNALLADWLPKLQSAKDKASAAIPAPVEPTV